MKRLLLLALCCIAVSVSAQTRSTRAQALLDRGAVAEDGGRFDEAERLYLAAREAAEQDGDQRMIAGTSIALGFARYYRGDINRALVDLQRGYDLYGALNDVEGRQTALENIAHVYADSRVAQYDRAIEYYLQLLPQYEAAGAATEIADTLF